MVNDALARALCKADGMVWWTTHIPAAYHDQAAALLADGWRMIPPVHESARTRPSNAPSGISPDA